MNRPDPRSKLTQAQLDGAIAAVAASKVLFVSSLRMRPAEIRNPLNPDLSIRILECHLSLQDRDETVIWVLDKEVTRALADQFNMLLDENEGLWTEAFVMESEPPLPEEDAPMGEMKKFGEGLEEAARELNPEAVDGLMIDGQFVPLKDDSKGTLPMGINRPEEAGDGEFDYLKGADAEHQHE